MVAANQIIAAGYHSVNDRISYVNVFCCNVSV